MRAKNDVSLGCSRAGNLSSKVMEFNALDGRTDGQFSCFKPSDEVDRAKVMRMSCNNDYFYKK